MFTRQSTFRHGCSGRRRHRQPVADGGAHRRISALALVTSLTIAMAMVGWAPAAGAKQPGTGESTNAPSTKVMAGGGNASGGALATKANRLILDGPKGTGLTRGITSKSITIGCITTESNYPGYRAGIQAAFAQANKKGINGRKLDLLPCGDSTNVQENVQLVEQAVQQNNAFAIMSLTQYMLPGSTEFLNANQVPYYGWGFDPGFCGDRWGFGFSGCLIASLLPSSNPLHNVEPGNDAVAILGATGLSPKEAKFAIQGVNDASGTNADTLLEGLVTHLGGKVVYNEANFPLSASGVDVTPFVLKITSSHPNVVVLSTPFAAIGSFAAALKASGYTGAILDYSTYSPGLLQSSPQLAQSLQGEYISVPIPPQEGKSTWVKKEAAALVSIGQKPFLTLGASIGYVEGTMLVEQLQAVGKNLNTKSFDRTVNSGKFTSFAHTVNGAPGKMVWPAGHFLTSDCAAVVQVKGDQYNVVNPFKCYSSYDLG